MESRSRPRPTVAARDWTLPRPRDRQPGRAQTRDRRMTQLILFNLFNGLIVGAFYALMALGLSLILNLSGVINFAHGGFLALGAYFAYTLMPYHRLLGRAADRAGADRDRSGCSLERLLIRRLYGRDPLYSLLLTFGLAFIFEDVLRFIWGAQSLPYPDARAGSATPLSHRLLLPDRLPALHGGCWWRVAVVGLFLILRLHAARHAHPRRHPRSRDGLGAGRQCARCCATSISASASIWPGSPACWRPACWACRRPSASSLIMPSFVAIIVGGLGSLPGTLLGGLLIGIASGAHHRVLPLGHRGGDLRHDGAGAADPAARPAGRGGAAAVKS